MSNIKDFVFISEAMVSKSMGYTEAVDDVTGQKYIHLEGEFQRAGKANKNNRIYSEEVLMRETSKLSSLIESRNGHPMGMDHPIPDPEDKQAVQKIKRIDLMNACALTTRLQMNNQVVYGEAKILTGDFGSGDKLASYVRSGFRPAVSSRGVGGKPVLVGDSIQVPSNYNMICYDFVLDPSTHNAVLEQKMYHEMVMLEEEIRELESGSGRNGKSKFYDLLVNFTK